MQIWQRCTGDLKPFRGLDYKFVTLTIACSELRNMENICSIKHYYRYYYLTNEKNYRYGQNTD